MAPAYQSYCISEVTGHQYVFSSARLTFKQAQASCNTWGGHLVSYDNYTEQVGERQLWRAAEAKGTPNASRC